MKKLSILTAILALFTASFANAQAFDVKTIATVDLKKILDESVAAKYVEGELNKMLKKYEDDAKDAQSKLEKRRDELQDQRKALAADAFEAKLKEFEERIAGERKKVQNNRRILETARVKALEVISTEMNKVVAEIAKEKKLDVVVAKASVLFIKEGTDISSEVLERLNKNLTQVNIEVKDDAKADKPAEKAADKKAEKKN
jgi:Skp family chaperone for outer membrane proteins